MRIAFVGLPLAALLLRADGHEIVWAGICRKGAIGTRRLGRATDRAQLWSLVEHAARQALLKQLGEESTLAPAPAPGV